jgi:hypothetical protein
MSRAMRAVLTLAAVSALVLALATAAGARGAAETKVTIKGPNGDFSGKIKSSKAKCLGDRKVIVYRINRNGYDPENDEAIAKDTSEVDGNRGKWSVGNTGAGPGAYYALAKRSPGCKVGFSVPLQI